MPDAAMPAFRLKARLWKGLRTLLLPVLLAGALTAALFVVVNGAPLWGVPSPRQVASVTVAHTGEAPQTYTDPEQIELAVKLLNTLNYLPFTPPSESSVGVGPDVTITYTLRDGRELSAGANWITGWWNGEARHLKQPDLFVNLTQGLFPPSYP